jgi:hypothetical protein
MVNVRPSVGEETEWVLDLPLLEGGVKSGWPGNNFPLYGCSSTDRRKLYSESTDLRTLCKSGAEERFAGPTFLVGPADGLGLGKGEGPSAPLASGYGACNC